MQKIFIQIIGIIAVVFFVSSVQYKTKEKILESQMIANLLYSFQYFLLGALTAGFTSIISCFRCLIFNSYKNKIPNPYLYTFIISLILIGIFNYNGPISEIPIIITITYIIFSYQNNTNIIRITYLICAFFWVFYNISVQAYIPLLGNAFEISSGIIALIKYTPRNSQKKVVNKK